MTYNDADWSVFWCYGSGSAGTVPDSTELNTGKHVGEDTDTTRSNETIGYIVMEAGSGTLDGIDYIAALGADTIQGMDNSPPFAYSISGLTDPDVAILSQAAMDGTHGSWALLYGSNPISSSSISLAVDEDVEADSERAHTTEQVAYMVFEGSAAPDTTAPTPNPLTWSTVPYATGSTSISMTATTASDVSGVEYYFDCTAGGGNDSGWQDSTTYQDTGLSPSTQYTYRVQARDKSANQNTGGWSTSESATTDAPPDTTAPTPNPLTWATSPYSTGTTSISMTATTASDVSGVEYFFDCTAGGGNDSGWQDGTTYEDTGLTPNTQYSYRVQARDKSANQNAGSWSTTQSATTDQAVTPALISWWEFDNDANDSQGDNDGTLGGSATYVNDSGYCLVVDGDNGDQVTVASSTDFDTTAGTWMMWVRTDGTWGVDGGSGGTSSMGSATLLNRHDSSSSSSGLNVKINSDGTVGVQAKSASTSVLNINSTGTVTNNAWHHIAVTWEQASGGDVKIYIDGSPDGSGTTSAAWSFNSQALYMGDSTDDYWEEYDGRLDEVRIYNYEMDSSEVESIYGDGREDVDTTPPTPNPMTWATVPYAASDTSISMAATTASDPSGVEYYFECTAGGGHSSGWQDSTTYQDTGLVMATQYTYRVRARDKSTNENTTSWSTTQSATTDVDPNLAAWWKLDNNADDSADDHDGTLSGSAGYVDDSGYCLEVDGDNNDMMSVSSSTDFDIASGTWMLWIRTDGTWGSDGGTGGGGMGSATVMNRHDSTNSLNGLHLFLRDSGEVAWQAKNASTSVGQAQSTGTVTNNMWHHVAVTYSQSSGGTLQIYIDGSPDGSTTTSGSWSFSSQAIQLGDSPDSYWEEVDARFDDVRVYDYALNGTEIDAIYDVGR